MKQTKNYSFQTSQDPSSPNAVETAPGASTSNNLAAGNLLDLRDGWDNEEWGSLEEEPVRRIFAKKNENSISKSHNSTVTE